MLPVKNIIFDLGGVIIDIEPQLTIAAFERHLGSPMSGNVYRHPVFHALETGKVSPAAFRNTVREELGIKMTDRDMDACLTAMLGEIPSERIALLERMKNKYNTFLLSNTNAIHLGAIYEYLQRTYGVSSLDNFFHKTYYSHLAGWRKPDVRFFQMVLNENNLNPGETLFLDDTEEHLRSAASLGVVTARVTAENTLLNILKEY